MLRRLVLALTLGLPAAGCMTGPLADNPTTVRLDVPAGPNTVLIATGQPGPEAYSAVFDAVLNVVDDYFEISYSNRYDGRIETHPRVAPGFEQPWKPSTPDLRERLYATLQSLRHRAIILIRPSEEGGYMISVTVFRELEDVPVPSRNRARPAFRDAVSVERQFEVVDPTVASLGWIPNGRDCAFEQRLLQQIEQCARR